MWLHIKFVKKVRERKIHFASNLQDVEGKSNSLESSACMKHTEPSLAVSLLPKNLMRNVGVKEDREKIEMSKRGRCLYKIFFIFERSLFLTKNTAANVIRAAEWSPYPSISPLTS